MLTVSFIGFLASYLIVLLLVRLNHLPGRDAYYDIDDRSKGHNPVLFIGRIPVFFGVFAALGFAAWAHDIPLWETIYLLICTLPIFFGGFSRDFKVNRNSLMQISLPILTAGLGAFLLGGRMIRLDIPELDAALASYPWLSLFASILTVGGITNAINIIDRANNILSSTVALLIFAALGYVSFQLHDWSLLAICFAAIGAISGYLVWNYPRRLVFVGDGGAFFLGFIIAEVSMLMITNHPRVSPLFPLLLVTYPLCEMFSSVQISKFLQNQASDSSDKLQLHQIISSRLERNIQGHDESGRRNYRKSLASPVFWVFSSISIVPAVLFWQNPHLLALSIGLVILIYNLAYRQFKSPALSRTMIPRRKIRILGTRGIPAQHGGFETFAEKLALHLASRGWEVSVYCQQENTHSISLELWKNIKLINIPVETPGPLGTIVFDWKSTLHASRESGLILTLGYNTALFCMVYRLSGLVNLINMDGIEWRRQKWSATQKAWLYFNEALARKLGNHLIADHPEILAHHAPYVSMEKITMIPYGADRIVESDKSLLGKFNLEPHRYAIVIARAEPENSILEIVKSFSRKQRGIMLAVVGRYEPERNLYHKKIFDAASSEVIFLGPIYDKPVIDSLRFNACLYIHGHTVGGTNPSLVEALGASLPVLAHDNKFNRWVAGSGMHYFKDADECCAEFDKLIGNETELARMKSSSALQHARNFSWDVILTAYEELLLAWCKDFSAEIESQEIYSA